MTKTEAEKREAKRQKKEAEEKAKDSPGAPDSKKAKSKSSSPVPEVAAASPSVQAAVAAKPSSASKRATKAKVVSFDYGYPVEGRPYRQADDFSDDDDGPAIITKKEEMRNIEERYSRFHEQLCYPHKDPSQVEGLTEGIDCPFWSLDNKANHSRLFFGPLVDMHENVWHETARRILIVREFLLSFENKMVDQHFFGGIRHSIRGDSQRGVDCARYHSSWVDSWGISHSNATFNPQIGGLGSCRQF